LRRAKERTKTRDKEDLRAVRSVGFRSFSPWVFLRVRPWIDSLSRTLVPDGSSSYDGKLRYVEDVRELPVFDDNDTLEPRVTRPVGDKRRKGGSFHKGLSWKLLVIATVVNVAESLKVLK